jgi:predicted SAM-dependent methyltransferase
MPTTTAAQFDFINAPRKLNLGCGFDYRKGFVNVDLHAWHNPDITSDVRELTSFPSDHFAEILANDVLEHLPRTCTRNVLAIWNRVLATEGTITIRVPSMIHLAKLAEDQRYQTIERQEELVQCMFGTQHYTGDFHFTSFTKLILRDYLQRTGFKVEEITVEEQWLLCARAKKVSEPTDRAANAYATVMAHESADDFVNALYRIVLKRAGDPEGTAHYLDRLARGHGTRCDIFEIFANSEEAKALNAAI